MEESISDILGDMPNCSDRRHLGEVEVRSLASGMQRVSVGRSVNETWTIDLGGNVL